MPRLITSDSEPMDFCKSCYPTEAEAEERYQFKVDDDANDGRGCCFLYEDDCHPPFENEDYTCDECDELLTEEDN